MNYSKFFRTIINILMVPILILGIGLLSLFTRDKQFSAIAIDYGAIKLMNMEKELTKYYSKDSIKIILENDNWLIPKNENRAGAKKLVTEYVEYYKIYNVKNWYRKILGIVLIIFPLLVFTNNTILAKKETH